MPAIKQAFTIFFQIVALLSPVFMQKLEYIDWNPVKAGIYKLPEEYKYSSANFYETGVDNWGFLTHYKD